ncbi:MAG: transglycosylase SLT domain-containing protein [Gammaproteobacteria bacterium]|nr:transglycosylase SLT domain-containing protein [Gammaproteobacteria bacterium]
MRRDLLPLWISLGIAGIGGVTGCASHRVHDHSELTADTGLAAPASAPPVATSVKNPTPMAAAARSDSSTTMDASANLWDSIAQGFTLDGAARPAVQRELTWYRGQRKFLREISAHAEPYLYYIATELRRRQLPNELVLLPILESGYRAQVVSPYGAAGLWQFMGGTGTKFGLATNQWRDERLDVVQSTNAALTYLETLHQRFDGDWLLAIAAYNAGWGNIEQAIAQNRSQGKPLDVWSLAVSDETHRLVGRLLALAEIVKAPQRYALELPAIPNQAFFAPVTLEHPTDLRRLVEVARIPEATFKALNPAFKTWHTGPVAHQQVLVPADQADVAAHLAFDLPAAVVPALASAPPSAAAHKTKLAFYTVRHGDSLWSIARQNDLHIGDLERLNKLNRKHALHLGQRIVLGTRNERVGVTKSRAAQHNVEAPTVVYYRVRVGDSLWTISRQFNVTVEQLLAWNKRATGANLQPGQEILVYQAA